MKENRQRQKAKCLGFFYLGKVQGQNDDVKLATAKAKANANAKTQADPSTRNSRSTRVISLRMTALMVVYLMVVYLMVVYLMVVYVRGWEDSKPVLK